MLMDFGASLQIDDSIDQADRIPHDTSLEANQSQQRTRLQKTTEQIKAVATCQEFVNPTSGQPQHQATTTSLTPPVQSSPNVAQPASSATNVSTSSSIRSSSSQPPDSSRPAIGHIQHQPLTDELAPVATSEPSLPPPPTPGLPPPGVPTGSQQLPATREPDAFDLHRSRCSSLRG